MQVFSLVNSIAYGFGAYGFWRMKTWMWPWASIYVFQIVISMFVWNLLDDRGDLLTAVVSSLIFSIPMIALWLSRRRFVG